MVTLVALTGEMLFATFLHETAHALVIHHHGRRVGRAGFGFYWGELAFFVDATDAFFLSKRQRIIQTLAGPGADALIASGIALASHAVPAGPWSNLLHLIALSEWIVVLINVAPILKLDGYWALADFLDQPDLYARAGAAFRQLAKGPRNPQVLGLAGYAVVSGTFGVAAVASSISIWTTHYLPVIAEAWTHGPLGQAASVAFVAPTLAGIAAGIAFALRTLIAHTKKTESRKEVTSNATAEASNPPDQPQAPHPVTH